MLLAPVCALRRCERRTTALPSLDSQDECLPNVVGISLGKQKFNDFCPASIYLDNFFLSANNQTGLSEPDLPLRRDGVEVVELTEELQRWFAMQRQLYLLSGLKRTQGYRWCIFPCAVWGLALVDERDFDFRIRTFGILHNIRSEHQSSCGCLSQYSVRNSSRLKGSSLYLVFFGHDLRFGFYSASISTCPDSSRGSNRSRVRRRFSMVFVKARHCASIAPATSWNLR